MAQQIVNKYCDVQKKAQRYGWARGKADLEIHA
jgi:hypothetical protein